MRRTLAFDMEVYPNYTLLMFKDVETHKAQWFERFNGIVGFDETTRERIRQLVRGNKLITFNGTGYDIPLVMLVLRGETPATIKKASDRIILQNLKPWNFEREFNVKLNDPSLDHIDLMEVAPLTGSLKLYGGRLHSRSLQDLPVPPNKIIDDTEREILLRYCENDAETTIDLYNALKVQLELREQMSKEYGIDLRSKSDAQIAEAVIKKEVETKLGHRLEKPGLGSGDKFPYQIPAWMSFRHLDILEQVKQARFVVSDKGGVLMPPELKDRKIEIGAGVYRMGIGGLHSSETTQVRRADGEYVMLDFDVVSYYPSILLNQRLFPRHIGPSFLDVYRQLVTRRLEAKAAKNKPVAESLKITINGTFGKLASKYSVLYSPDLFIQITLTGQLALLMLIEALADVVGVEVVSANTDGVTVRCHREAAAEVEEAVKTWELITEFETEKAEYAALYSRDVNSYIAVKTDGEVKTKGEYGAGLPLHKNPNAQICSKAVIDYLTLDASIAGTIHACHDIRQFVCIRTVKGGATYRGKEIGRIVRWYYSTEEEESLLYKVNNYLVPKTLHARPCIVLPTAIPDDLDRQWYIDEALSRLKDLGVE